MSNRSWFYASSGQQQGPYPEAQLRDLITRGTVGADTLVWTEGMSGWQRAGDIPGLVPGGSGPPSFPQPGGPPPVAAAVTPAELRRRCAVDRCRPFGPPLAQPGVHHRHRAGDSVPLGRNLVLSLDRLPALRAGPAEPRLHRPAPRYLVRLHCDRRFDLCGLGRPLLPAISLDSDSGRAVLDGHSLVRFESQLQRPAASDRLQRQRVWAMSAGKCCCNRPSSPLSAGPGWSRPGCAGSAATSTARSARSSSSRRGLEVLWRTIVFVIACIFIIPIPWVLRWYAQWYASQFALAERGTLANA